MNINELFEMATNSKASDLHIVADKPPILRIAGELKILNNFEIINNVDAEKMIFSILTDKQKEDFIRDRELDFSYEIAKLSRYRVNLHWARNKIGLVARVISNIIPSFEDILLPEIVNRLIDKTEGLILITGPTGCGKSTTLATLIEKINHQRFANIITLEDPIEFIFKPAKSIIKQRQLGTDIKSFHGALKHVLRQDPNVIMVGEMRDLETIATTITLAETGHLVLATLHTHSASQTVDRIIDVFPPHQQAQVRLQLSLSLKGVVSQHLLPTIGGGRIAAREILINTPAVANLIRENKIAQLHTVVQTSINNGMFTMEQNVKELLGKKLIDENTALAYLSNSQDDI